MKKLTGIKDLPYKAMPGVPMLLLHLVLIAGLIVLLIIALKAREPMLAVLSAFGIAFVLFTMCGLTIVQPNQAVALTLFGRYVGTLREPGMRWVNPFFGKGRVSLRVRNVEAGRLKVNDSGGSPIEIACILVWQVGDAAEALFNVESYTDFVATQAESALRQIASQYPYDLHDETGNSGEGGVALRSHGNVVSDELQRELQDRLANAGVTVLEARISHLAYAPEIASAMLQRQQAAAIIAARAMIVEGAVGMVESALQHLSQRKVVELDDERRASMVSNLLVVLCGERGAQPVLNTGSLY